MSDEPQQPDSPSFDFGDVAARVAGFHHAVDPRRAVVQVHIVTKGVLTPDERLLVAAEVLMNELRSKGIEGWTMRPPDVREEHPEVPPVPEDDERDNSWQFGDPL